MSFRSLLLSTLFALLSLCGSTVHAAEPKLGVLMLHGKNPGSNRDPNFRPLVYKLEREDWIVRFPNMPWANGRYIDGNWDLAMQEIETHVKELRAKGAEKIVLMGHSIGVPAAMSFAARGGDVQALVLLAPVLGIQFDLSARYPLASIATRDSRPCAIAWMRHALWWLQAKALNGADSTTSTRVRR